MAADDMRYYETFYGIHTDDWVETFGAFANHHKLLVKEYISNGCTTTETSTASPSNEFLYPQHIKKVYFIEGVITGHITIGASGCTCTMTKYRVTVCKMNENTNDDELFTTGWITLNDTIGWDAAHSIGEERVYPFWIDAWEVEKLDEHERIFIRVEAEATSCCSLWHSNDATWEDLKVTIPFRM